MIKKISLLLILQLYGLYLFAQEEIKLDSLKSILNSEKVTEHLNACQELYDFYIRNNTDSALKFVDLKIKIAEKTKDSSNIAKSIKEKGTVYWSQSNYIEALKFYQTALKIYTQLNDKEGVGMCLNNVGLVNHDLGNYEIATDYYLKGLRAFGKNQNNKTVAIINNNLGNIFTLENDLEQAKLYFTKALDINSKLNIIDGIKNNYINLGLIADKEDSTEMALDYYQKALEICIKINDKLSSATCYTNIAVVFANKKEYTTALSYYDKAIEANVEAGNPLGNINDLCNIGIIYSAQNKSNLAINNFQEAYDLAIKSRKKDMIERAAYLLALEYGSKGFYKMASEYHIISRTYRDSLFDEDTKLNISRLEMKHQFENKVKELELQQMEKNILQKAELEKQKLIRNYFIGGALFLLLLLIIAIYSYLLKKRTNQQLLIKNAEIGNQSEEINLQNEMLIERNEKITEQKDKIEQLNKSKDKIFSIIGHDLRSVVGTTASSLGFLANKKSAIEGENTQLLLNELRDNAKRTFDLLENLLSWGKSQMYGITIEPAQFDIADSIKETISFLNTMAQKKNIALNTKFEGKTIVFADIESIKTVIRNLISNAIKFTEKNGEIEVSIMEVDNKVKISITDNGIGISDDEIQKIMDPSQFHTTTGTSHEGGAGLGLSLCHDYLVANNSKLQLESKEGQGSVFYFYLSSNTFV